MNPFKNQIVNRIKIQVNTTNHLKMNPQIDKSMKRHIHASSVASAVYPPFNKPKMTRRATLNHLRKMKETQEKLGPKFRLLEKHHRYKGLPGYKPPQDPNLQATFVPFLLTKSNLCPNPKVVPGSIKDTMTQFRLEHKTVKQPNADKESLKTDEASPTKEAKVEAKFSFTVKPDHIPTAVLPCVEPKTTLPEEKELKLPESASTSGPFYAYGLTPSQLKFVLQDTPEALKSLHSKMSFSLDGMNFDSFNSGNQSSNVLSFEEQAEIVRRVLSIENANMKAIRRVNQERISAMLQRRPNDVGSFEVQAGMLTLKINAMKDHLESCKKDTAAKQLLIKIESRRIRVLKYLRRTNLAKFVETCKVIGIEPDTIRA